ncbi:hypothetical protein, partial [Sansalvadorimonas verongulae]|uniref:hypothetical protein n=1 Tax=Sansalvadorimonas verongulae TaxID=2172824 RepID=UPI0012BBC11F
MHFSEQEGIQLLGEASQQPSLLPLYSLESPLLILGFGESTLYMYSVFEANGKLDTKELDQWQLQDPLFPGYQNSIILFFESYRGGLYFSHISPLPPTADTFANDAASFVLDDQSLDKIITQYMAQEKSRDLLRRARAMFYSEPDGYTRVSSLVFWDDILMHNDLPPSEFIMPPLVKGPLIRGESITRQVQAEAKDIRKDTLEKTAVIKRQITRKIEEFDTLTQHLSSDGAQQFLSTEVPPVEGEDEIDVLIEILERMGTSPEVSLPLYSLKDYRGKAKAYKEIIAQRKETVQQQVFETQQAPPPVFQLPPWESTLTPKPDEGSLPPLESQVLTMDTAVLQVREGSLSPPSSVIQPAPAVVMGSLSPPTPIAGKGNIPS